MELKIVVDDSKFESICKDELEALDKADIGKAMIKGVEEYLATPAGERMLEKVLFERVGYSDKYNMRYDMKYLMEKSLISNEDIVKIKESLLEAIEKHGKEVVVNALVEVITARAYQDDAIRMAIQDAFMSDQFKDMVKNVIYQERNNGEY